MVLDHALWLDCVNAVSEVLRPDETRVFAEGRRSLVERLLQRPRSLELGTLDAYGLSVLREADPPEWEVLHWRRSGALIGVAAAEYWYRVGGPDPYHDSYTTRLFISPDVTEALVDRMRLRIEENGGTIDRVLRAAGKQLI